jgi:hypothetical protein
VLWRKSAPATKATILTTWREDTDVIDYYAISNEWTTAVGYSDSYKQMYKNFPHPLVIIRPPQLVAQSVAAQTSVNLWLWYTTRRVSEAQMAELMVKDHD